MHGEVGRHQVILLGTIHKFHLSCEAYSLGHVKAAFQHVNPQLLLVEVRPQAFAEGRLSDGPFEMTYLTCLAQTREVVVEGIDWFEDGDGAVADPGVDVNAMELEIEALRNQQSFDWPPAYAEVHRPGYAEFVQAIHEVRIRYLGDRGDGQWSRRNLWMAHNIRQAIARHRSQRVLVAVGAEHLAALRALLGRDPALACSFAPQVEALAAAQYAATDSIVETWSRGATQLQQRITGLPRRHTLRKRLEGKLEYWQQAIAQRGVVDTALS